MVERSDLRMTGFDPKQPWTAAESSHRLSPHRRPGNPRFGSPAQPKTVGHGTVQLARNRFVSDRST